MRGVAWPPSLGGVLGGATFPLSSVGGAAWPPSLGGVCHMMGWGVGVLVCWAVGSGVWSVGRLGRVLGCLVVRWFGVACWVVCWVVGFGVGVWWLGVGQGVGWLEDGGRLECSVSGLVA